MRLRRYRAHRPSRPGNDNLDERLFAGQPGATGARPFKGKKPGVATNALLSPRAASRHDDGLRVYEFPDSMGAELAAVARGFHAAEREAGIGLHAPVHEHHPRIDRAGEAEGSVDIPGPQARPEPVLRVVRDLQRVSLVPYRHHRRHGAEHLLIVPGHPLLRAVEDGRIVEEPRARQPASPAPDARSLSDG